MIRLISVFFLTILALLAFNRSQSYASDKKTYVANENEELYGTWVNEDYNGSSKYAIFEWKADGTFIVHRKTTDELPWEDGTYTITDKWTESNGDIWYKVTWDIYYFGRSGFFLICISNSGSTLESANSFSDYPTQIDPSNKDYQTYMGIRYRKQK